MDFEEALDEVAADHSSLETVVIRLANRQRTRTRRAAAVAAAGAGLAVAVVAGSIFTLRPAVIAQTERNAPATETTSVPVPSSQARDSSTAPASGTVGTAETDPGTGAATDAAARERARQAAAREAAAQQAAAQQAADAAAAAERARIAASRTPTATDPVSTAARGECLFRLRTQDTTGVFSGGDVDTTAAQRLALDCLGGGSSSATVSWVVTGLDDLSDALGYQQQRDSSRVAVVHVRGTDAQGAARDWLVFLLPNGEHRTLDGHVGNELVLQLYPAVTEFPREFALSSLGPVHQ